jgi:hypothetical protein
MTTAILMPLPKQQFLSAIGTPLIGGKVYTYAAGTTNPKQTFSDPAGTTPQANPITLNVRGEPASPIYWSGNYRVDVRDALGNLVYSVDNYSTDPLGLLALFTSAGASLVRFIFGAGAKDRSVADKLRERGSVFDYMTDAQKADVISGNPVLDHTAACQTAITNCQNLYWGDASHKYRITSKLAFNVAGQRHYGGGALLFAGDTTARLGDVTAQNVTFDGLAFDAGGKQPRSALVYVDTGANYAKFAGCTFKNMTCSSNGISVLNQTYALLINPYAVLNFDVRDCVFKDLIKYNDGVHGTPTAAATIGYGFIGGVCFLPEDMTVPAAAQPIPTAGTISGCVFDNIQSILAGGLSLGDQADFNDADAIRTYGQPGGAEYLNVSISDCTFRNVSKRAFKLRAAGSVVDNCNVYASGMQYGMIVPIDVTSNCRVSNVNVFASSARPVQIGVQWSVGSVTNIETVVDGLYVSNCISGISVIGQASTDTLQNFTVRNMTLPNATVYGIAQGGTLPASQRNLNFENIQIIGGSVNCAGISMANAGDVSGGTNLRNVYIRNASLSLSGINNKVDGVSVEIDSAAYAGPGPSVPLFNIGAAGYGGYSVIKNLFINAWNISPTFVNASRNHLGYISGDNSTWENLRLRVPDGLDQNWPHAEFLGSDWNLDGFSYDGPGRIEIGDAAIARRFTVANARRLGSGASASAFLYTNNAGTTDGLFENVADYRPTTNNTITINAGARFIVNNVSSRSSNATIVQNGGLAKTANVNSF